MKSILAIAPPHPQQAIAPHTSPKSDSCGALRYRTLSTPQTAIPTERFAIALPHPKSDRIPTPLKQRSHILQTPKQRFLRSASLSHSQHPSKQRFLRSASLSHSQHPKSDRIPNPQKAIALPTSPTTDRSSFQKYKLLYVEFLFAASCLA
jgi:hypothetical protein